MGNQCSACGCGDQPEITTELKSGPSAGQERIKPTNS